MHIEPFINSLASSGGLYGNFELSLERYRIDLLIKSAKYFMISSAHKPKPFRVPIEYRQGSRSENRLSHAFLSCKIQLCLEIYHQCVF